MVDWDLIALSAQVVNGFLVKYYASEIQYCEKVRNEYTESTGKYTTQSIIYKHNKTNISHKYRPNQLTED